MLAITHLCYNRDMDQMFRIENVVEHYIHKSQVMRVTCSVCHVVIADSFGMEILMSNAHTTNSPMAKSSEIKE